MIKNEFLERFLFLLFDGNPRRCSGLHTHKWDDDTVKAKLERCAKG